MTPAIHSKDYAAFTGEFEAGLLAALLAPVAGDRSTGSDLRHEGTYDSIAEARRHEDDREAQGVWEKEVKRADWLAVAQICGEALELRSKDLQIAAWLTEAWCKLHGFAGLTAGLRLTHELCRQYWSELFPPLEDADYRAAPFHWLNEKLAVQLKFIPLTRPADGSTPYTWSDWEIAQRADQQRRKNPNDPKPEAGPTSQQVQLALRQTPAAWIVALETQVAAAEATATELENYLDENLASAGASLRLLRGTLQEIQVWLGQPPYSGTAVTRTAPTAATSPAGAGTASAPEARPEYSGRIASREEAYLLLAEAADYLQRTEPHSPAPYLIHRAIRWGSLPLDQLLPELVRNEGALGELQQLLNLRRQ